MDLYQLYMKSNNLFYYLVEMVTNQFLLTQISFQIFETHFFQGTTSESPKSFFDFLSEILCLLDSI